MIDSPLAEHLAHPRGRGALADAPHRGAAGGAACGDVVTVAVRVDGARVAAAGFDARGCAAATAAGSAVVELVEGAPVLEAARVTPVDVEQALGGLSPERRHAAALAAEALHRALGAAAADGAVRLEPSSARTLVAMSGGVDSAMAAQLALDAGHEVVAVTLELWADAENDGERSCCSPQAVGGARALAHGMGLPHLTLDLREPFRRHVVEDFVAEHAAGRTPNPCVRCNGGVRFAEMLRLAGRLGAARLATGHYARLARDGEGPLLESALDDGKDQAYVLARLSPTDLGRLWFPLGELTKDVVRERARGASIAVADRPDSQDLCFLSGTGRDRFLRRHGRGALPVAGGELVSLDGRVLGRHDGQERFTVGQRRGLGLASGQPLFVLGKDAATGRVTVGPRTALAVDRVALEDAVLHRDGDRVDRVKLRYRSEPLPCRVEEVGAGAGPHERLALRLEHAAEGVAPGQTACLMDGERVVGAGVIAGAGRGHVTDVVELVTPVGRDWDAVARLVLAGVGERLNMSVEELDDLQLAVERLLVEAGPADAEMRLVLEIDLEEGVRARLGPLRERAVATALRAPAPAPGELDLRRILETVVDSFEVEDAPDGGVVVALDKSGHRSG